MYLKRNIDGALVAWRNEHRHKPLLLRGARQVGKSSAVRHLGESFDHYIEVNFEKRKDLMAVFDQTSDVKEIAARFGTLFSTPIVPGKTLLFLDEVQTCPKAIESLWAFKEDYPELHVVAAGSLLEFTLKEMPSFGVGRIRSMFMYPMSFDEFLLAVGKDAWVEAKQAASPSNPLPEELHEALVQQFRTFLMVGGMPASVVTWVETHDYLQCQDELEDIQQTYYDDFVKYSTKIDPLLLRNTLRSVIVQMGHKFVYARVEGGYRNTEVKRTLGMLADAGIIKLVQHSAANGLPLGAEVNDKFRKYYYLDTGLYLRILDLELGGVKEITELILAGAAQNLVNKGSLAEQVACWEQIKCQSPRVQHDLYYWENLQNGTLSEVDFLTARNMTVLPIEVKSGTTGKMKSLREFMRKKHLVNAVRTSLENFGTIDYTDEQELQASARSKHIDIYPIYAFSTMLN